MKRMLVDPDGKAIPPIWVARLKRLFWVVPSARGWARG
jgi:hypothetical protein